MLVKNTGPVTSQTTLFFFLSLSILPHTIIELKLHNIILKKREAKEQSAFH